jgi:CBS domain containing-hemolysin-like protein
MAPPVSETSSIPLLLWIALALALLAPLLTFATGLLERAGPIRLRHWVESAGGRLRGFWEDPRRFGLYRLLINLLAKIVPLTLCLAIGLAAEAGGWPRPFLTAVLSVAALLALTEIASRRRLLRDPEGALDRLTWFYRAAAVIFFPVVRLIAPLLPRPLELATEESEEEASEEEVEAFIDVGTQEGILEPEDRDLVWGVVDFGDTQVKSVMTPRVDMICGNIDDTLDQLADRFVSSGYSRLPLFRESIDQIVGIAHLRDLLTALRLSPEKPVAEIAKPPFFVPETKLLGELLKSFQARRQQMAIVINEFGATEGLVTIEDLVEEIVGEIADEHDEELPENRLLDDGSLILDGRAAVETLDEFFGVRPNEEGVETVGGLLSGALGRVPAPGERLEHSGLEFEVEKADERRILSVRVRRGRSEVVVDD